MPMVVAVSPQPRTESPAGDAYRAKVKQEAAEAEARRAAPRAARVAYGERIAAAAGGLRDLEGETDGEAASLAAVLALLDAEARAVTERDAWPGASVLRQDDPLHPWAALVHVAALLAATAAQLAALRQTVAAVESWESGGRLLPEGRGATWTVTPKAPTPATAATPRPKATPARTRGASVTPRKAGSAAPARPSPGSRPPPNGGKAGKRGPVGEVDRGGDVTVYRHTQEG